MDRMRQTWDKRLPVLLVRVDMTNLGGGEASWTRTPKFSVPYYILLPPTIDTDSSVGSNFTDSVGNKCSFPMLRNRGVLGIRLEPPSFRQPGKPWTLAIFSLFFWQYLNEFVCSSILHQMPALFTSPRAYQEPSRSIRCWPWLSDKSLR